MELFPGVKYTNGNTKQQQQPPPASSEMRMANE